MTKLSELRVKLKSEANPSQAKILSGFFKTGKGEYGEGDEFYGIKVPVTREIAKKYAQEITLKEAGVLLNSKTHEERLCALLILVAKYEDEKASEESKTKIFEFYLKNAKRVNNWDLVDLTAPKIIGEHIFNHREKMDLLTQLIESKNLWEQRIAMLATYYFIKRKEYSPTLKLSEKLLNHKHDLMHKATGWMLREVGKCDQKAEEEFLYAHYKTMPRTMLRYAIEKFPKTKRKAYLEGKI